MQWIVGFPSKALAILDSGPFPGEPGYMDLASAHPPGQYLKLASNLALSYGSSLILNRWG